ncbi:hypothetical protein [Streptomyces sp. NPDC058295]|uniref:hypothetical protein n=1 Tax=Streptomyces sp. NPDC058295 TaxID=3346431 RepID=UPI0036E08279
MGVLLLWRPCRRATPIDVCGESNQSKLALYLRDRDVPEPIGQDQEAFNECVVLISAGTALHIG